MGKIVECRVEASMRETLFSRFTSLATADCAEMVGRVHR